MDKQQLILIMTAMFLMLEDNATMNKPKVRDVEAYLDFKISAADRDAAWDEIEKDPDAALALCADNTAGDAADDDEGAAHEVASGDDALIADESGEDDPGDSGSFTVKAVACLKRFRCGREFTPAGVTLAAAELSAENWASIRNDPYLSVQ